MEAKDKWYVTCPADYSFGNLVIGTGNTVFASCSPNGVSQHPFVYVIDAYGTKQDQIEINENVKIEAEAIAQNSQGDVLVATEKGGFMS